MRSLLLLVFRLTALFLLCLVAPLVGQSETGAAPSTDRSAEDVRERIAALRAEIAHHDHLYYVEAAPEISDEAYDRLKRELRQLESAFPEEAQAVGETVPLFGDDRQAGADSLRHRVPMGSLDKAYSMDALVAFDRRVRAEMGDTLVSYRVEPKYDGMAVSLTYEQGELVRALSRGDGTSGEDLTAAVRGVTGLPLVLEGEGEPPAVVELRGEIYLPWAAFHKLNTTEQPDRERPFANPRNVAVGTIRSGEAALVRARGIRLVVFGRGAWEPEASAPRSQGELDEQLTAWGFAVPRPVVCAADGDELKQAVRMLEDQRDTFPFPSDGLVIKVDDRAVQSRLGEGADAPRWAIAYKWAAPSERTRLLGIDYEIGRTGRLTPVARLQPVVIDGTTVTRASLHHPGEVRRLDLHRGDSVAVELSGGIIPQLVSVDLTARLADAPALATPTDCPACSHPLMRKGDHAQCANAACPARLRGSIAHFARTLRLPDLGPAAIQELVASGQVSSLADLYALPRASASVELKTALRASLRASLEDHLVSLGIPGVGPSSARRVAASFQSFQAFAVADAETIESIADRDGWPPSLTRNLLTWRADPTVPPLLEHLIALGFGAEEDPAS